MNQKKLTKIESDLKDALKSFNWNLADEICGKLIEKIYGHKKVFSEKTAKNLLFELRRKRRFHLMSVLGEAIIRSDQTHPQIVRQYAQSLIDQGVLKAAEFVLQSISQNPNAPLKELVEAYGLIGRIYKQLYVNTRGNNPRRQLFFDRSLNAYSYAYRLDRQSFWNAINIVALLKRAEKEGISLQGLPDADQLAEEVLSILKRNEKKSVSSLGAWEIATNLEALIALKRFKKAKRKAFKYSLCLDADAFEINSTLRQLIEVWQLDDKDSPGAEILPILRAALLSREGSIINLTPKETNLEIESLKQMGFEKRFGKDKSKTLRWYLMGLERTRAIARIETTGGKGIGTGWLVRSADFFPNSDDGVVLVTNAHVVSNDPKDEAYMPHRVRINFQGLNKVYEIDKLVRILSRDNLDAAFLKIKGDPPVEPLPINHNSVEMCEPLPRAYVIGHPSGRDLEISFHDSHLVACNETFLHYRTPTEEGSSGSPVFDEDYWEVIALHHRGKNDMPRLDGTKGVYEANEGITISAIKKAIENGS